MFTGRSVRHNDLEEVGVVVEDCGDSAVVDFGGSFLTVSYGTLLTNPRWSVE